MNREAFVESEQAAVVNGGVLPLLAARTAKFLTFFGRPPYILGAHRADR